MYLWNMAGNRIFRKTDPSTNKTAYQTVFYWLHWVSVLLPVAVLLFVLIRCENYPRALIEFLSVLTKIVLISVFILRYLLLKDCRHLFFAACAILVLFLFSQYSPVVFWISLAGTVLLWFCHLAYCCRFIFQTCGCRRGMR